MPRKHKLIKNKCEIESCNVTDPNLLEFHHIISRTDPLTSNENHNLAILCCNCHKMIDTGELITYCIFPSTKLPNKRTLVYSLNGIKNVDLPEVYLQPKNKSIKITF